MEIFDSVGWLAVFLGTVVSFLLGWVWYSPIAFFEGWAKGSGLPVEAPEKPPVLPMLLQISSLFLLAIVVGIHIGSGALVIAVLSVLAAATFVLSNGAWIKKSGYALIVDFVYVIVSGLIMLACQLVL